MPDPPEDEGLNVVRRDEPEPHLIYGNLERPSEPLAVRPDEASNVGVFTFLGTFIVFLLIVVFAWTRFHEPKPEKRTPVIGEKRSNKSSPIDQVSLSPSITARNTVPVLPDMLRVTSIALGTVPLAIVNGKRVAEGDRFELKTARGVAVVQVEKIEDRVVHFRSGETTIEAKLIPPSLLPSPSPSARPR